MGAPCSSGCTQHPPETPCSECDGEEEGGEADDASGDTPPVTELAVVRHEGGVALDTIEEELFDFDIFSE